MRIISINVNTQVSTRISCKLINSWHSKVGKSVCPSSFPVVPKLRLKDGPTNCSGRVEVFLQGGWGTMCDDSWDKMAAQVVCRQLDCGEAAEVGGEHGPFGQGNGTIWRVNCTGSEPHLLDCCHAPLKQSDCTHKEDAWVKCTGTAGLSYCRGIRTDMGHTVYEAPEKSLKKT